MATTIASAASSATRNLIPRITKLRASKIPQEWKPSGPASKKPEVLINDMHKKLYPQLYDGEGVPTVKLENARIHSKNGKAKISPKKVMLAKKYGDRLVRNRIVVYPHKSPSIKQKCPDPVATVTQSQIARLDPTGVRTRLFAKTNPECARVGDILLVRLRSGDPFSGVCINIRRRGVDTAILLRGQLTRVGVEMWYKVYSPLVEGIEVVQRAAKRARRARLTYMRNVKHDRGSVENIVRIYLRQKAALGTAEGQKKKNLGGLSGVLGGTGKKRGKGGKRR
ncbi:hypothetical protein K504DRAFT_419243 [Pleomassaria siparia CBS 279.74]|uniref:Mitochondrial ribosomal protein-like protein n=1 Tax=Pleomassaria siparia CBS 279.74 TaxID=1314801 RepID=A0A6G1JRW8_9PLEO|nr:hypothetical protein K504DRAFT_419243 [Pleomassaria siparia CBS 279.74]